MTEDRKFFMDFDEGSHTYTIDGKVVPSVTQILSSAGIFDASKYPDLEYYRERGSANHKATELWEKGTLDEDELDERIKPFLESYKLWKSFSGFESLHIELRCWDALYGFAGTMDRVGMLNGHTSILDLKSNQVESWCGIQLAGYELLCPSTESFKRYGLALQADGSMAKLKQFSDRTDRKVFLGAMTVYKWRKANGS